MASVKILGIRTSPSEIRYAVLEKHSNGVVEFLNKDSETQLRYPASHDTVQEKLKWLKSELDRILRQIPDIDQVLVKINEFSGIENKPKRESSYADAICILAASEHQIPIQCKLYSQISTTSQKSMGNAEEIVGRTAKYWNKQMADAVMVAYSAIR